MIDITTSEAPRPHVWDDILDDEIRQIYANYGERLGLTDRPALLCVDNYNAVFGDRREPILEAIKRFPSSCGPAAWDALEPTRHLIEAARSAAVPVIHTTRDNLAGQATTRLHSTKRVTRNTDTDWGYTHFAPLSPLATELVIRKPRASAFFGTALATHLTSLGINTIIICGNSTSGCVRATVNEAYMLGYRVGIVEECVFDRNPLSHKVNLFDMNAKYADVMFLDEVLAYLSGLHHSHNP